MWNSIIPNTYVIFLAWFIIEFSFNKSVMATYSMTTYSQLHLFYAEEQLSWVFSHKVLKILWQLFVYWVRKPIVYNTFYVDRTNNYKLSLILCTLLSKKKKHIGIINSFVIVFKIEMLMNITCSCILRCAISIKSFSW